MEIPLHQFSFSLMAYYKLPNYQKLTQIVCYNLPNISILLHCVLQSSRYVYQSSYFMKKMYSSFFNSPTSRCYNLPAVILVGYELHQWCPTRFLRGPHWHLDKSSRASHWPLEVSRGPQTNMKSLHMHPF